MKCKKLIEKGKLKNIKGKEITFDINKRVFLKPIEITKGGKK